ncbi:hypothetical protein [Synechococcus phage S-H25]|nr:hypothetical protein [Synechococcus phage S-H25]
MELPPDFIHEPPENYRYESLPFKRSIVAIWTVCSRRFTYNSGDESRCIWGFYDTKKRAYYAPINSKQIGAQVDINSTTPYSAMQLNLKGLELLWM